MMETINPICEHENSSSTREVGEDEKGLFVKIRSACNDCGVLLRETVFRKRTEIIK